MNSRDWPLRAPTSGGNGSSAPSFSFGTYSNYDCNATHWGALHTAANTINWANIDSIVTSMRAIGVNNGVYVVYGCPTFLAQAGQAAVAGPFGGLGEGSYPTDLAQLTYFCNQFKARNAGTWGGFFTAVQLFNEPEGGNFSGTASNLNFYWGTATQYVDMLATAYAALTGSGVAILSPGTYSMTTFATWLAALGPVTGKYGYECFDAVASHPYHAMPNGTYAARGDFQTLSSGGIKNIKAVLQPYGKQNADIYFTEYGLDSSASTGVIAAFLASPEATRKQKISRLIMAAARSGAKSISMYSYGGSQLVGDLATDTNGVGLGVQEAYDAISGKTIVSGGWYSDGREQLTFSDGTTYTV